MPPMRMRVCGIGSSRHRTRRGTSAISLFKDKIRPWGGIQDSCGYSAALLYSARVAAHFLQTLRWFLPVSSVVTPAIAFRNELQNIAIQPTEVFS